MLFMQQTNEPDLDLDFMVTAIEATRNRLSIETTAIAQLTANPENASLMTPFYAEVLFNEAIRYITTTPTLDPLLPTPQCWLVADYWQLHDLSQSIEDTLSPTFDTVQVDSFVSVVWNVENCGEYIPVSNRIRIFVETDEIFDETRVAAALPSIMDGIISNLSAESDLTSVKSNVEVMIAFANFDSSVYVQTNLSLLESAIERNLSGQKLIDFLGGIQE